MITRETTIEDLVTILPESVNYFMEKGIRLLICGEPVWGTIEEIVSSKSFSNEDLDEIVSYLNTLLVEKHKN